jgi:hypothetical protein
MSAEKVGGNPDFPKDGILWQRWSEPAVRQIVERRRPVLIFVADRLHPLWPFLREAFAAMPKNARLRALLHEEFPALYLEAAELPEELARFGAGSQYHLAILQNPGFDPLLIFDPVTGDTARLVGEIVTVLERLLENYRPVVRKPRRKSGLAKWFGFLAKGE